MEDELEVEFLSKSRLFCFVLDDASFDWDLFWILIGSIGGAIFLALFTWGVCYCVRSSRPPLQVTPQKQAPLSFVQAFPVVSPTYVASQAPTVYDGPSAQLGGMTFQSAPSLYGSQSNVRNPMGVTAPVTQISSLRRPRRPPSGGGFGPPTNGILRRSSVPRAEGSLLGQPIDADFYPDVEIDV